MVFNGRGEVVWELAVWCLKMCPVSYYYGKYYLLLKREEME